MGLDVATEDADSRNRLDMVLRFNGRFYLFEFRVMKSTPGRAGITQLKDQRHAKNCHDRGQPIRLLTVEFSSKARNLASSDEACVSSEIGSGRAMNS